MIPFYNTISHPGYFGKVGMRRFHYNKNQHWCPTINVDKLWSLVGEEEYKKAKERKDGKATVIDVMNKVLLCGDKLLTF